ncbi:hypothetical protein KYI92_04760 [Pantoea allii]|uniref:Uncharacterized protein n=1 Tax=Pantoea allii TaxID=574096 RepID=A0ABS6VBC8_9GAMM|nr:hypothetical protein [Pantoea allii]MBW1213161.1 hypothetical protein [Pantoea allii]MBW1256521.1 hypothetical protein [Pantoea allii]MBW1265833.1 hypothetical protein [Pantoea allii]MBW1287715.1 hypothetical protein [Pantoea allii]
MNSQIKDSSELEYRVGYTPLSGRLYAGFVRRDTGKWEAETQDVTDWAMLAVAQKLVREDTDVLLRQADGRILRLSAVISEMHTLEADDEE